MAINPLLLAISQNPRGILVNNISFKVAAYADDIMIGIGSVSDWTKLRDILGIFEKASNFKVNKTKSILALITENAHVATLQGSEDFKTLSKNINNTITILGYKIDLKGNPERNLWHDLIVKMKKKIEDLS